MDGPALCLVDIVDLHLHDPSLPGDNHSMLSSASQNGLLRSPLSEARTVAEEGENWAQLVLEPAHLVCDPDANPVMDWSLQVNMKNNSYPYLAYYVIHDTGIHLVRVSWLQHVSQCCRKLPGDSLNSGVTSNESFAVDSTFAKVDQFSYPEFSLFSHGSADYYIALSIVLLQCKRFLDLRIAKRDHSLTKVKNIHCHWCSDCIYERVITALKVGFSLKVSVLGCCGNRA